MTRGQAPGGGRPDQGGFTALVVSGGGFQGLAAIKCLRDVEGVKVVVADCHDENVGRYFSDVFHRIPRVAEESAFITALLEICARDGVRLVLPATEFELRSLAQHRAAFEDSGVAIAVSSVELLQLARNKRDLLEFLAASGLPVLPILDPRTPTLRFPIIGKPLWGWGGRDILVIHSREELERCPPSVFESHVWQPLLESFREFSVDFAVGFDGTCSPFGIRSRLRTSGGVAVVTEDVSSPSIEGCMTRLAAALGPLRPRGVLNAQLLEQEGALYVSDLNLRIGTSAVHWCGTSLNPVLHVCRSLDPAVGPTLPRAVAPRRMVRYLDELWLERAPEVEAAEAEIRAVVFDLDDTLIHQKRWILEKLELLHARCPEVLPDRTSFLQAALRVVEEGPRAALFDELATCFGWDSALTGRLIDAYRTTVPSTRALYPDVRSALHSLRRKGLKLAVLTDNPPASQRQKLEACQLHECFDAVVFTREVGAEKPDPRGFEAVAARLGMPPRALAIVGDNPHRDALGALSAGYGMAYVLRREGTFFNFDLGLLRDVAALGCLRSITGLRSLQWFLGGE